MHSLLKACCEHFTRGIHVRRMQEKRDYNFFWNVITRHYFKCRVLWDGYTFPVSSNASQNGSLNDYNGEFITFPYPGYTAYHAIDDDDPYFDSLYEHPEPNGGIVPERRDRLLTCSILMDFVPYLGPHQGAK